jgi:hypothetical protein
MTTASIRAEALFVPVAVLALWTCVVLFLTGFRRVTAARAGRVSPQAFRLGESADVPPDVIIVNRHLMNLLEMPLLFYVVALAFYVTREVSAGVVLAAWIYVSLRFAHSTVHLTSNRILPRLATFFFSNVVLLGLWICLLWRVL